MIILIIWWEHSALIQAPTPPLPIPRPGETFSVSKMIVSENNPFTRLKGKFERFYSCDWPSNLTQIGFKSSIFLAHVTLKFDGRPPKQQDTSSILCKALCITFNPPVNSNWSYSLDTLDSGQTWLFCVLCDLEIWWMPLENNRAHLFYPMTSFVYCFKAIGEFKLVSKSAITLSRVTLTFFRWPWETLGYLFYTTSSYVHRFVAICEF